MRQFILATLTIGGMLAFIIWIAFNLFASTTIETPTQTYAVVINIKPTSSGSTAVYQYRAKGDNYTFWGYYNYTLVIGDKFLMEYDSNDIKKKNPFYHLPIFLENEKRSTTIGNISRIKWYYKQAVHFEYVVNGKLYKRIQLLPDEYKEAYPDLTKGKEYQVEYWNQNPQRAIVYLDKPL